MDGLQNTVIAKLDGAIIHPTAVISRGAEIGSGVRVGPFCTVGPDVTLEDGVELVSHVVVDGRTRIGAGAKLYPFSSVGLAPQDLKYRGEPTRCEIGPRTQVREHCTIHRGTVTGSGLTHVGADCMLMAVVHIAHDCWIGDEVIIANNVVMGGHVTIEDMAVVGGQAALHQYVRIGRGAMIGGVTGVGGDVIPFGKVIGNRGWLIGLNVMGLRRRGFSRQQIHVIRAAFRLLFAGDGVFATRVEETRWRYGHESLIAEILAFIDEPHKRGLIRSNIGFAAEEQEA
jgi:UDP-N-acetylglucosamine acyltransferase